MGAAPGRDRVWGIEGTGSYGAGLTRTLQAAGETVHECRGPTAGSAVTVASPTRSTPRSPPHRARRASHRRTEGRHRHRRGATATPVDPTLGAQGPYPGGEPAARLAVDRTGRPEGRAVRRPLARDRQTVRSASARADHRRTAGLQTSVAVGRPPLAAAHPGDHRPAAPDNRAHRASRAGPAHRFGVGRDVTAGCSSPPAATPNGSATRPASPPSAGCNPIPASSGKTNRHRLNRAGDRQANAALHTVALTRMRSDPRTRAYVDRRTAEGLGELEIMRCLKRYIARELYPIIIATQPACQT